MPLAAPLPEDWTCPVCTASHTAPTLRCRRCGAALLFFVRLAVAARTLTQAGCPAQAAALTGCAVPD